MIDNKMIINQIINIGLRNGDFSGFRRSPE
jgi:hypothetical protein